MRTTLAVPYKHVVTRMTTPVDLVQRNLPMRNPQGELKELFDAYAAHKLRSEPGVACGLYAPMTGNYWFFNEAGVSEFVQQGVVAKWAAYLRDLCRNHAADKGELWAPPSFTELGSTEYWGEPNATLTWI